MSNNNREVGHGGARKGSGRKKLSWEEKRGAVTLKVLQGCDAELEFLATKGDTSKAAILETLTLSPAPEADEFRKWLIAESDKFTHRQPGQTESAASEASRAALKRKTLRLLKAGPTKSASKNGPR